MATYIYSRDGNSKVNIDTATLLGDVASELNIYQQGDRAQLWRSAGGSYFTGSCLHHACGKGCIVDHCKFIPISKEGAKAWVFHYYGPDDFKRFGFDDTAQEI